jgi:nicotinamidase-related amidase
MSALPARDPIGDHLLTSQNSALLVIDYQPGHEQLRDLRRRDDVLQQEGRRRSRSRPRYAVYPVVDAIGGSSEAAHRSALERVVQAGSQPVTWIPLGGELQRDWARTETAAAVVELVRREPAAAA